MGNYRKFNSYEIEGDIAIIKTTLGNFIIDAEDLPKINKNHWNIYRNGYVYSSDKILLHRIITNCPKNKIVDHINHNKSDNRKSNLRICDYSVNGYNRTTPESNTHEFGISKTKRGYYVIYVDGKYCGTTKDLDKAIILRDKYLSDSNALKYNSFLNGGINND